MGLRSMIWLLIVVSQNYGRRVIIAHLNPELWKARNQIRYSRS